MRRGFGLLEVLISASLLIIGLAGVVSFAAQADRVAGHQKTITIGAHVAELQMEKLLILYSDDSRLAASVANGPDYDDVGNPVTVGRFKTSWVVQPGVPIAGARTIIVTVSWAEDGKTSSTSLRTIRT